MILNHPFLELLTIEIKLKNDNPNEAIKLVVEVVCVIPVQLCDTYYVPLGA